MIYVTPSDDLQKIFDSLKGGETLRLQNGVYRQKTVLAADGITLTGEG